MPSRDELESLFLAHLPAIERIVAALARRHGLSADATDELSAWIKLKLIENDYAIPGKFRGESALTTYLTVVIAMLYRGFRVAEHGRWRPSSAARRLGEVGVRLETLIRRDRLSITQAGEHLRTSGATTLSDRELAAIASRFPHRQPLRPVQQGAPIPDAPASNTADERIIDEETEAEAAAVKRELNRALACLDPDERLMVRLRYQESMSVADIARGMAVPQKPLYRRLERALGILRAKLERAGISPDRIAG